MFLFKIWNLEIVTPEIVKVFIKPNGSCSVILGRNSYQTHKIRYVKSKKKLTKKYPQNPGNPGNPGNLKRYHHYFKAICGQASWAGALLSPTTLGGGPQRKFVQPLLHQKWVTKP